MSSKCSSLTILAMAAAVVSALPSSTVPSPFTVDHSQCPKGDMFCEIATGNKGSYCKHWQQGPGGSVCQGTTTPCQCNGCKGDNYCHAKVGPSSYCKYWQKGAGKVCQYSNLPCDCEHDEAPPSDNTVVAEAAPLAEPNINAINHTIFAGPSQCPKGDMFCENTTGNTGSYCKYWQQGPGGSVCQGTTTPCQCGQCKGDSFCHAKVGPSSYCKYWQKGAGKVCQYSNLPCDCK